MSGSSSPWCPRVIIYVIIQLKWIDYFCFSIHAKDIKTLIFLYLTRKFEPLSLWLRANIIWLQSLQYKSAQISKSLILECIDYYSGCMCQKQVSRAWISNSITQNIVITYPCPSDTLVRSSFEDSGDNFYPTQMRNGAKFSLLTCLAIIIWTCVLFFPGTQRKISCPKFRFVQERRWTPEKVSLGQYTIMENQKRLNNV